MTNQNIERLNSIKCFILDMDGTIYLGNRLIDGAKDFLEFLKMKGIKYLFFTNNSSKNKKDYLNKLRNFGISVTENDIISSSDVTIDFIKKNYQNNSIYLVGTPSLINEFEENNLMLCDKNPDIVMVGFDTTLNYEKLRLACSFIRNGSIFIATNEDVNCPTEDGFIPDCGSICELIKKSTGKEPRFIGKPNKTTHEFILSYTGFSHNEIAYVGDRLYTDIAIGNINNSISILVLSGETKKEDLINSKYKPDYIFNNVGDIINFL
ncbi:HAD-IIA family hydrolase [Caldicellulosiruptoraceae bacterium PP1]